METNDAPLRPGRHNAATPDRPPVSRRELRAAERREISVAEFQDTWDFPGSPQGQAQATRIEAAPRVQVAPRVEAEPRGQEPRAREPWSPEAATSRRARRTAEAPAPAAAAHHAAARRRPRTGGVARRTAMSMAGSGVALVGIAVAAHKAPDSESLDEATRDILSGAAKTKAKPMPQPTDATRAQTEYQVAASGKAPAAAKAGLSVRQPPTILGLDPALHLARRAAWGPTPALVAQIRGLGTTAWLERQLKPSAIPDIALAAYLEPFDTLGATPAELRAMNDARSEQNYWYAHDQLESAAIARATWSERQLFEVLVDFWHSRLHVPAHLDKTRDTLNHYDTAVIRKHAFGRFSDMLWAMITHPAMIQYLDNQNNTKDGGNQNLGRELLELHTLGVDAGYRQADVDGAARLLTGMSIDPDSLAFVYRPEQHHVGRVKVAGHVYPNTTASGGPATVRSLINTLAMHPQTAHYLALDLARRFVSDAPSERLVKELATVYLKNKTAIVPVLRALFRSPEFAKSVGQKYRRPFEHAVASMRALGMRIGDRGQYAESLADLRYWLDTLGQAPLGCPTPDGFKDFQRPWLSSAGVLGRWNLDMSLVAQWRKGLSAPDVSGMLKGATTYGAAVDRLYARLAFQKPSAAERQALLAFVGSAARGKLDVQAKNSDDRLRVQLVTLIMGGPHHQLR
jgi:uncharacterized protein (DUF1800 family)